MKAYMTSKPDGSGRMTDCFVVRNIEVITRQNVEEAIFHATITQTGGIIPQLEGDWEHHPMTPKEARELGKALLRLAEYVEQQRNMQ